MNVEDIFCSKVRMKVLMLLCRFRQLNTSGIAERLKVSYELASRHLDLLEKENVVQHRLSGRIKYFRFTNSVKALATMRLVEDDERNNLFSHFIRRGSEPF